MLINTSAACYKKNNKKDIKSANTNPLPHQIHTKREITHKAHVLEI